MNRHHKWSAGTAQVNMRRPQASSIDFAELSPPGQYHNIKMKHCPQCALELPDHFQFCGSCGWRLELPPQELRPAADFYDEETMSTARVPRHKRNMVHETRDLTSQVRATNTATEAKSTPTLTILSAYSEPETPSQFRWWHGVLFGFLLLLFVSLGIGGWYWWSREPSITQTSQSNNSNPEPTAEDPSPAPSYQPTSAITPQHTTTTSTADEEIRQLRERRIKAKPSERLEMISALEQAEEKYRMDYRFPYELSKVSIKGIISHDEAFEPLARAAQKAIDNGQADEMLNSLMADKYGDFHKLSHGHHEWAAIEQALRNKDKGVLKTGTH